MPSSSDLSICILFFSEIKGDLRRRNKTSKHWLKISPSGVARDTTEEKDDTASGYPSGSRQVIVAGNHLKPLRAHQNDTHEDFANSAKGNATEEINSVHQPPHRLLGGHGSAQPLAAPALAAAIVLNSN